MNKKLALNKVYNLKTMPQEIIYDVSDSEDETDPIKGNSAAIDGEVDPELMLYIDHLTSIKVEEQDIQEIVDRYISATCKSEVIDYERSCSYDKKVFHDIYADPIPSCSHQNVGTVKVTNALFDEAPSNSCEKISQGTNKNPSSERISEKEQDIQEIVDRYISAPCKSEVKNDLYYNPTPGCSHHLVDAQNSVTEREIKCEPELNIEICPSLICDTVGAQSSSVNHEEIPDPIENIVEGSEKGYETPTITHSSESVIQLPEVKSNGMENSLSNTKSENGTLHSIYLASVIMLYKQIKGLHNFSPDLNKESYIEFCQQIANMKADHGELISEVEKGDLIKFEQLAVWGRNLKRNVEDLIKEAKPGGSTFDEAQKFVLHTMHYENRYRQRLADSNETYMFNSDFYAFRCMACDRRDTNLPWLVGHLCRDTAEITYMCCFCGFLFFNNACSLIYHVVLDSLEESKEEYCVECEGFFPSVAEHLMDFEGSWKAICNDCDFISLSQCSSSIHQRYHKMEKHHVCPECGAYFVFFEALEDHLKNVCYFYARKIRRYCDICEIIFKDKESLCRHLLSIHHKRLIKCIQCHMLLTSRIQYISHRAQNHPESPCTYHICHTCTLCPDSEFKSSAAQYHMKNHANDVINVIFFYVCDCNYYTLDKCNFIEHKAQNCEATPSFGKWDNDHEMKVCHSCNDIKFVNLTKPFVCESCELSNNSEQVISRSLKKTYACKLCKLFLTYNWEAVIEHFFCFHPTISVHKYPNSVKSTYIAESNNDMISRSSDEIIFPPNLSNDTRKSFCSLSDNAPVEFCRNPQKMGRINDASGDVINCNVSKPQPVGKKQSTRKKCKTNNVPFYISLSHFMDSNPTPLSNQLVKQIETNNAVMSINNIPSLPINVNDISIRLEPAVSIDRPVPERSNNMLQANDNDVHVKKDSFSVVTQQNINPVTCVSLSSSEAKYDAHKSLPGNFLCSKNSIEGEVVTPNQSAIISTDNTDYALITAPESSTKTVFKGHVVYVKKTIGPNHTDQTNNHLIENLTNMSSEELIETNTEVSIPTKKKSYECKRCKYKCDEDIKLVKHFVDAHYIQNTYQCMECGDCFANLKNKINHLRLTHKIDTKCYLEPDFNRLDTCRSKFKCPVCLRGFLSEQDKNLHMRCHGMAYLKSIRSNSKEM